MRVMVVSGAYAGEEGDVRATTEDGSYYRVLLGNTLHWIDHTDCEKLHEEEEEADGE